MDLHVIPECYIDTKLLKVAVPPKGRYNHQKGCPHDFDKLSKITKTSKSENDDPYSANFQQLFKEIRRKEPRHWMVLSFWITYLKANPYTADLALLIEETTRLMG